MPQLFLAGSYTHPSLGGEGKGIYTCALEPATGEMFVIDVLPTLNPSYLAFDSNHKFLFAVQECATDLNPSVHSFSITGLVEPKLQHPQFKQLSTQPTYGEYSCHLSLDATNRFLAVANYGGGNVVLYPVGEDGMIGEASSNIQHQGKGVNPERQEGPHAHATVFSPDNRFIFVADLGLDEVKTYTFDTGKLELHSTFKTKPGAGPRHLEFHPNGKHAFIINELDTTVVLVRYEKGAFTEVQTLQTLPSDYTGQRWAAAIHVSPNGRNVYVSNRTHDSIAVLSFDAPNERLELMQHIPSGGTIPRDFSLDPTGKLLITAHQNSHDLYSFWVDETGRLEPTGHRLELGSPVCVKML
jgi:6-phosphogluconolactonase